MVPLNAAQTFKVSATAAAAEVARQLRAALDEHSVQLRDVVAALVSQAAAEGAIRVSEGRAYATGPDQVELDDASHGPDRETELRARREEFRRGLAADPGRQAAYFSRAHLRESLTYLLRDGFAQSVALRALEYPLIDTPAQAEMLAATFAVELNQVAYGHGASQEAYEHVLDALDAQHRSVTGVSNPWWTALRTAFFALPAKKPPEEQVQAVLGILRVAVADCPAQFREPRAEHLKRAAEFMRTLRMRGWKKEFQPPAARGGPGLTEWGAARAFARCFGVTSMPEERDATRDWSTVRRE